MSYRKENMVITTLLIQMFHECYFVHRFYDMVFNWYCGFFYGLMYLFKEHNTGKTP